MPRHQDESEERDRGGSEPGGTSPLFLLAYFGGIVAVAGLIVAVVYFTAKPADVASGIPPVAGRPSPDDTPPDTQPRKTPGTRRTPTGGPSDPPVGFQPFPQWKEFAADGVTCSVPGDVTFTASADRAKALAAIRPGAKAYESNNSFNGFFYLYVFPLEPGEAEKLSGSADALDELLVKVVTGDYAASLKSGFAKRDDKVKPTDAPFLGKTGREYLGVQMAFTPVRARAGVAGNQLVVALAFNMHEGPKTTGKDFLDRVRVP